MSWWDDTITGLTGYRSVEQLSMGTDLDVDAIKVKSQQTKLTNREAYVLLSQAQVLVDKSINVSEPRFPGDPGVPDIQSKKNLRDEIEKYRLAADSYPGDDTFPLMTDLRNLISRAIIAYNAAEASIGDRNQIIEKLGEDLRDNASNLSSGIFDIGSGIALLAGAAVLIVGGYAIYKATR